MRRILLAGAAVALAAMLAGSAHAKGSTIVSFVTPSGNIGCVYSSGIGPRSLRCDIASGLKPRPSRPRSCSLDWGDSYTLNARGRAHLTCHGDTAILPGSKVLAYGTPWSRGGFVCLSRSTGLRCKNRGGRGFVLSREHSSRF